MKLGKTTIMRGFQRYILRHPNQSNTKKYLLMLHDHLLKMNRDNFYSKKNDLNLDFETCIELIGQELEKTTNFLKENYQRRFPYTTLSYVCY
jgi:hypothetical protein